MTVIFYVYTKNQTDLPEVQIYFCQTLYEHFLYFWLNGISHLKNEWVRFWTVRSLWQTQ